MDNQELNEYIKTVVGFSFDANKYFNDSEPWSLKKKDPERMNSILFTIVEQIKNISILLNPIIPNATNKALAMINISIDNLSIDKIKDKNILNHKKELGDLEILFNKIEDDN
jgi:methionyl-tRNA synthetase